MRRVWGVYIVRKLTAPAVRVGVFLATCFILAGSVSVPDVFQNAFHVTTVQGLLTFTFSAFAYTSTIVQVSVIATMIVAIVSIADVTKKFREKALYA
jgi:hypothetical protein